MSRRYLTRLEFNAILAGLRLLEAALEEGDGTGGLPPAIQEALLDKVGDDADLLNAGDIDELVAAINHDEVQLTVEEDDEEEGS